MAVSMIKKGKDFIIRTVNVAHSGTTSTAEDKVSAPTVDGYTPIGVVGFHERTAANVYFYNMYLNSSNQVVAGWQKADGASITNHSVDAYVLYKSN